MRYHLTSFRIATIYLKREKRGREGERKEMASTGEPAETRTLGHCRWEH